HAGERKPQGRARQGERGRRVGGRRTRVLRGHSSRAFAVSEHHRLVGENIDEPRDSAAGTVDPVDRPGGEHAFAQIAGDSEAMREVVLRLLARQSSKVVLEGDALAQLPDRFVRKPLVELGLAEQDHLDELAFFGLEVGEQLQSLEGFERHRLGLVQADHDALFLAREIEEREGQRLEQMVLVEVAVQLDPHFLREREQQRPGLEVRVGNVRADPVVVERSEEFAAQERLSGAHLAGELQETLAVRDGDEQRVQRLLAARARVEEARVGSDPERGFAQAEVGEVDHYGLSNGESRAPLPKFCIRSLACSMPSSQSFSPLMTVGFSRMTSSLLILVLVVFPNNPPTPGMSCSTGMPERSFATSTFINPPRATMFPSWTRTMVSVSLIELFARGSVVSVPPPPKLKMRSCCTTLLTSG